MVNSALDKYCPDGLVEERNWVSWQCILLSGFLSVNCRFKYRLSGGRLLFAGDRK